MQGERELMKIQYPGLRFFAFRQGSYKMSCRIRHAPRTPAQSGSRFAFLCRPLEQETSIVTLIR